MGKSTKLARDDFFDDLNNPKALYFIGLLWSDGWLEGKNGKSNKISIELNENDVVILKEWQNFCGSTHKLQRHKHINKESGKVYYSIRVEISAPNSRRVLERLGFTNKKSLQGIPSEELIHKKDFWRGVIDGDGCLQNKKRKKGGGLRYDGQEISIDLCGNSMTVNFFQQFIHEKLNINDPRPRRDGENCWRICYGGLQAIKIIDYLYSKAPVYLYRKMCTAIAVVFNNIGILNNSDIIEWHLESDNIPSERFAIYKIIKPIVKEKADKLDDGKEIKTNRRKTCKEASLNELIKW